MRSRRKESGKTERRGGAEEREKARGKRREEAKELPLMTVLFGISSIGK